MSGRKGARQTYFVCAAFAAPDELITLVIPATSQKEAAEAFLQKTTLTAKHIHGPFLKKRAQIIENTRTLKFADQTKRAIYNGWEVNAFFLKEPENQAYLVFLKRVDNVKQPAPKGTIVVSISDLRIDDE